MKKPNFQYPATPPAWLARWPAKIEIDRLFSLGIRTHANRVGSREAIRHLKWTDSTLELAVGTQRPIWHFDGATWKTSCSCGYPGGACVHCYLAATLLRIVCLAEGWQLNNTTGTGTARTVPQRQPRNPRSSRNPGWTREQSLFLYAEQYGHQSEPAPPSSSRKLIVEADFHYQPGKVTLRFYIMENEQKSLLRIPELRRLGERLKSFSGQYSKTAAKRENWPPQDAEFLIWAASRVFRSPEHRHNLNLLRLSESRFQAWQETWKQIPDRIIERSTQQPLRPEPVKCSMRFELQAEPEMLRVGAVITLPDGQRYHFHEIFKLLAEGRRHIVVEGRLLDFTPPISWRLLTEFFARKSPGIPCRQALEFLPVLIEQRFDLLDGDLLVRQLEENAEVQLGASHDGVDIRLAPRIGPATIHPEIADPTGNLRQLPDGRLAVTLYRSRALPPVQALMAALPLVRTENGTVYRLPGRPEHIARFLERWRNLPKTVKTHFTPELSPLLDSDLEPRPRLQLERKPVYLDLQLSWRLGKLPVSDRELRTAAAADPPVTRTASGHWLTVNPDVFEKKRRQIGLAGFGGNDRLRLFLPDARYLLLDLEQRQVEHEISRQDQALARELINQSKTVKLTLPPQLESVLRNYQKKGFEFMADRLGYRIGTILADDMGLGKTLQVLALLQAWQQQRGKQNQTGSQTGAAKAVAGNPLALVVCPASVAAVWLNESNKFCPDLTCRIYAGQPGQRQQMLQDGDWDLLVANYALVRNDIDKLRQYQFDLLILDEAQQIKNPGAQVSQATKKLSATHRLALTGTPLENRLVDLWSIMDFLNPGFLGTRESFIKTYEDTNRPDELGRLVAPIMLRRTKSMVAPELPPRIDEVIQIELGTGQRALYDRLLHEARARAEQSNTAMEILALLTRLRQACCDPRLISEPAHQVEESAKLTTMMEMIEELIAENHSVLVFSQFVGMLKLIEPCLIERGLPYTMLTGATPVAQRGELVRDFNQDDKPGIFLLSLKAAGTGLTLTRADYVFIYDPWWNPAVENQAIDRTHRIGQTKTVMSYRLVAAATVEENVMRLKEQKAELFNQLLADSQIDTPTRPASLTVADLQRLLG